MGYQKMYYPKWDYKCGKYDCDDDYEYTPKNVKNWDKDCDKEDMEYPMYDMDCCMPKMKCKTEKKCVKTFSCTYKLYKVCTYKIIKVCPRCGCEYEHGRHPVCPKCRQY